MCQADTIQIISPPRLDARAVQAVSGVIGHGLPRCGRCARAISACAWAFFRMLEPRANCLTIFTVSAAWLARPKTRSLCPGVTDETALCVNTSRADHDRLHISPPTYPRLSTFPEMPVMPDARNLPPVASAILPFTRKQVGWPCHNWRELGYFGNKYPNGLGLIRNTDRLLHL